MEFDWSPEQRDYRARIRRALDELLPEDWEENYVPESYASDKAIDFSREFCPALADRGLLVSHWPEEYGGSGAEAWEQFILAEEMKAAGEPRGPQYMNVNWLGPTLMKYGSEEQKRQHLGPLSRGEVIWCQGYSEPDAGTDLANLKTRAEPTADGYVINGSKIWTSYARKADYCFLLARTGSDKRDISVLLVPMDSEGISVTSYQGLAKFGHLNEVYFTDVRVPREALLGEESKGWEIVTNVLTYERVGVPRYHSGLDALDIAVGELKAQGRFGDPIVRARAGSLVAKFEAARLLTYLVVDQRVKNLPPSADANISRVAALDAVVDLMNFLMEFLPECLAGGHKLLEDYYRVNVPACVTAGTYELQLDLIAMRDLGLPRK